MQLLPSAKQYGYDDIRKGHELHRSKTKQNIFMQCFLRKFSVICPMPRVRKETVKEAE